MNNTKEQLILAGLEEINTHGIAGFSTRRVAKNCNISCAAPYKHFKDTDDFISEILGYINDMYISEQRLVLEKYKDCSSRERLIKVSLHYIRFLVENPEFRRVIMQNYNNCDEKYRCLRGRLSSQTYDLVSEYCRDVNMSDEARSRKTFMIRSIIYGSALFFDNNEMEYNEENMQMVCDMLNREFDLP